MQKSKTNRPTQAEQASTRLALFIAFNAMIVHEALATLGSADPLSLRPRSGPTVRDWLVKQWKNIQTNINYEPVFQISASILERLPAHPVIERTLNRLAGIASGIVATKALLKHDIAGRIYHTLLLRSVARGLGTYYTSIPGAYLLAKLAVETPNTQRYWENPQDTHPVIADLACGSGTLLSAAYSAVVDHWTRYNLEEGRDLTEQDVKTLHRLMLEEFLVGFDVLDYAVHLAASWLTLRMPDVEVHKMRVYTLPLGRVGRTDREVWLGSLSMTVEDDRLKFPVAQSLTGERLGPEAGGTTQRETAPVSIQRPRLIIMNPPFARTGNVGHSILLGHLPPDERDAVLAELRKRFSKMKESLGGAIGKAGLAAPFVWLAHRAVAEDGRLAFVLPRVAMSGVSWEAIRKLWLNNYRIDHIVVGYDPKHHWAWSENTDLSEMLIVCTKHSPAANQVKVTYVYRRPRSALESKILASRIIDSEPDKYDEIYSEQDSIDLSIKRAATTYKIAQSALKAQRNWNVCLGFASSKLSREARSIHVDDKFLGSKLPLTSLGDAVAELRISGSGGKTISEPAIGFDVATYERCKSPHGSVLLDTLEGANVSTLNSIQVPAAALTQTKFKRDCADLASRIANLLTVGVARFRINTVGLVAVFTKTAVISNTMWSIGLRSLKGSLSVSDATKIQVLWLNSTPGLLNTLSLRQDSAGAFVQLKKEYLPELKLLDVTKLKSPQTKALLELFADLRRIKVESIPVQLKQARQGEGFRHELDSKLLKIIGPGIDAGLMRDVYDELLHETIISPEGDHSAPPPSQSPALTQRTIR